MDMNNSTTLESEKDLAQTPRWFVNSLEAYTRIKFTLDVCAYEATAKCECYLSLYENNENGLELDWEDFNFCNPPYSDITPWIDKALNESMRGKTTAILIPDKAEVGFTRQAREVSDTVIHMPFRLKFIRPDGTPFLGKNGKESGPKFAVCVYLVTPWGLDMPVRDVYHDFRTGFYKGKI